MIERWEFEEYLIVDLLDYGLCEDGDSFYLVDELVGEELDEVLE